MRGLRLAIPKGSLEEGSLGLFRQAGIPIGKSDGRNYGLSIRDPRFSEAVLLKPQEVSAYVAEGEFDIGISGSDWIAETGSKVEELADLGFSRNGSGNVRIVLACEDSDPVRSVDEIPSGSRIVTEYPEITKRFFAKHGKGDMRFRKSYGATEGKVPRLAEYLVDAVETGTTLIQNGKRIIATIMESSAKLIANPEAVGIPEKKSVLMEIAGLLAGTLMARQKSLIKMNVPADRLSEVIAELPSAKAPTVSRLCSGDAEWLMVESVVDKRAIALLVPRLKRAGATDILETRIERYVP